MQFLSQKAVKGQVVADFLAEYPDPRVTKLYEDLPDEVTEVCLTQTSFERQVWQLFFDGASRTGPRENIIAGVESTPKGGVNRCMANLMTNDVELKTNYNTLSVTKECSRIPSEGLWIISYKFL